MLDGPTLGVLQTVRCGRIEKKKSFLNAAFGSEGKIQLHDTETIAAALLLFLRRHKSGLLGKTIDLKSAYRQLPLSSEALAMSFIAVKNPETGEVQFFIAVPALRGSSSCPRFHPSQLGAVPLRTDLLVAPLVGVLR